jgi:hypothetical protein
MSDALEPAPDEELAALHRDVQVAEGEKLLATTDLTVKFGGLTALDSVTFPTAPERPPASTPSPGCTGRRPVR